MKSAFGGVLTTGEKAVDSVDLRRLYSLERPDRAEARSALPAELVARKRRQLVERLADRILEQLGRGVRIRLRTVGGLGNDRVGATELKAVDRIGLERGRRLPRLAG